MIIIIVGEPSEANCSTVTPSLTWYMQIAEAVTCSASDDMASSSSTLNISDTTSCPCGGTTEWCYTWMSDDMENYHEENNTRGGKKHLCLT